MGQTESSQELDFSFFGRQDKPLVGYPKKTTIPNPSFLTSKGQKKANFQILEEWGDFIPEGAFSGNNDIVKVKLPDRITKIGKSAFKNCRNLKIIEGKGVTIIGDSAFRGCISLETVNFNERGISVLAPFSFSGCRKLSNYKILSGAKVDWNAFFLSEGIKPRTQLYENDFQEEWKDTVPTGAFRFRFDVKGVSLPERITKIESYAFNGCVNLKGFKKWGVEIEKDAFTTL